MGMPMAQNAQFEFGGFSADTTIATPRGARKIAWLCPGDRIISRDRGTVTLRRLVKLGPMGATAMLPAGALGAWRPDAPLVHVPGQYVMFRGGPAELLFGAREVLCPVAPWVLACPKRRRPPVAYQLEFDRQELVLANGLWCATARPAGQETARRCLRHWEALLLKPAAPRRQHAA